MHQPEHIWMVRAGNDNILADRIWDKSAVALGWELLGDIIHLDSREAFKDRYQTCYPEDSTTRVQVNAGQVYRFARQIQIGDYVLTAIQSTREILIGIITSGYEFAPTLFSPQYPHVRRVEWLKRISRDVLSSGAQNSTGSSLTLFNLDDHISEFHFLATGADYMSENGVDQHIFLTVDQIRHVILRTIIPSDQICLYKLLYLSGAGGLTLREMADVMCDGDLHRMQNVLDGLSLRIVQTNELPVIPSPKYQVFFFLEGDGEDMRLHLYPEVIHAIESIPELLEIINSKSVVEIYAEYSYSTGHGGLIID